MSAEPRADGASGACKLFDVCPWRDSAFDRRLAGMVRSQRTGTAVGLSIAAGGSEHAGPAPGMREQM